MTCLPSRVRAATVEVVVNHSPGMRAHVDTFRGAMPYLIIADGTTELLLRPQGDTVTDDDLVFADALAEAAGAYATELRQADR